MTHIMCALKDSRVNGEGIKQTPTFSKRNHNQGSVHKDGVCQVL